MTDSLGPKECMMQRPSFFLMIYFLLIPICVLTLPATLFGTESLEVEIRGVEANKAIYDNIMAHLGIVRQRDRDNLTPAIIRRFHDRAESEIDQAVKPFGYYRSKVTPTLQHDKEKRQWLAVYDIDLGPPLIVETLNLEINGAARDDPAFVNLVNHLPIQEGDILNQVLYENIKQQLNTLSEERGYFAAQWTQSLITVDEQANVATIHLALDSGPRYCLLPVKFNQSAFKAAFLNDFITFQPGDPFSVDTLLAFRNALDNSDYFSQVNVIQNIVEESDCVQLEVDLEPKKKDRYTVSGGYGTDSQLRLGLDWRRRYLNRLGHRLGARLSANQRKRKVAAQFAYLIPSGRINEDYWEVSLNHKAEDIDYEDLGDLSLYSDAPGGTTRDNTFFFRVGHHHTHSIFGDFLDRLGVTETVALEYLLEYYNLLELIVPGEEIDLFRKYVLSKDELMIMEPDYRAVIPSIRWMYTRTDSRAYARHGEQIALTLKGASESLGSNFSFFQVQMMNKWIRSLGDAGRFIGRLDAVYTDSRMINVLGIYDEAILPKSLQFSTGGDRSVRGYAYEELDGMDTLVEARHFLNVSVEYEHLIKDTWSVAAFTDIGNAFNDYANMDLQYGAGFGVRWRSPIGLIGQVRLDIAWALSKDNNPARLHLVIGPDF